MQTEVKMKKKTMLENWKTKTIAMLMAGIMVFAMAPLGTAVAFADEENADVADDVVAAQDLGPAPGGPDGIYTPSVENVVVNDEGVMTWDHFQGARTYEIVIDNNDAYSSTVTDESGVTPSYNLAGRIDYLVNQGEIANNGSHSVVINARGAGGILATWSFTYTYTATIFQKVVNKGATTIDLSKGPVTLKGTLIELNTVFRPIEYFAYIGKIFFKEPTSMNEPVLFDLDKDGTWDFSSTTITESQDGQEHSITFNKLEKSSIKNSITLSLDPDIVTMLEKQDADEDLDSFYSTVTFVFGNSVAKKANTLTVKAKKMTKIKAKKMKKKAKSFNLSKFVTISGAQGPVTYAKASGNKKITVAPNGTVTLKKKIKKGTYKVKVNVTAAGNAGFNAVTKAVTFKVKVK